MTARADDDVSHQEIRRLVEQGELLSLNQIKTIHPEYFRGRLLRLEIEKKSGAILYELVLIDEYHRVTELKIDASSGKLFASKQDANNKKKRYDSDDDSIQMR